MLSVWIRISCLVFFMWTDLDVALNVLCLDNSSEQLGLWHMNWFEYGIECYNLKFLSVKLFIQLPISRHYQELMSLWISCLESMDANRPLKPFRILFSIRTGSAKSQIFNALKTLQHCLSRGVKFHYHCYIRTFV